MSINAMLMQSPAMRRSHEQAEFEWNTREARTLFYALSRVGHHIAEQSAPRTAPQPFVSSRWPACCALAVEMIGCVCARAWKCPAHGETHHGTHD